MKKVPEQLLDFIKTGTKFLIAGHREPDGDCVGSQLALASVLTRMGKEAILCSAGPFKRTEVKQYEPLFISAPDEKTRQDCRVLITDCSSPERTGDLAPFLKGLPYALIDHHQRPSGSPGSERDFIDSAASSVTGMILFLIDALGVELLKHEAEYLLFGLCTDTGFFRHTDSGSAETFEAAARMIRAGASPKKAHQAFYGGKSLDSRQLLGRVLGRAEPLFDGRLILSTEEYDEVLRFGKEGRDSDALYQLLQSVSGVEATVIIRQEAPDHCTVGFRSLDRVDVAEIAGKLGGGGHKNAAGALIPGTIAEVRKRILEQFKKAFGQF